jgi:hypothetical protein
MTTGTQQQSLRIGAWRRAALCAATAPAAAWGLLALWLGSWPQPACAALAALYAAAHLAALALAPLRRAAAACLAAFLLPLLCFQLMRPSGDRSWQPDVAQLPRAEVSGDSVTVYNVRACEYRSEADFTPRYETRRYALSKLRTADIFLCDWGLRKVAHAMLSFGFDDGQHLCFSIETRKEVGESYSAIRGLFRQYELIFVAGDERDLVRLRTTIRQGETVRLYRMVRAPPKAVRAAFLDYLARINALSSKPEWYNALTENCMVGFFQIARRHAAEGRGRWHWSVILNGYADEHAYETGALDTSLPFDALRERSVINERARAAGDSPRFSALIREDLPGCMQATEQEAP